MFKSSLKMMFVLFVLFVSASYSLCSAYEFEIFVVYLAPSDRVPAVESEWQAQVNNIRTKTQCVLEIISDFYKDQIIEQGIASNVTGRGLKLEMDTDGKIKIHAVKGDYSHRWYWGDGNGNGVRGEDVDGWGYGGLTNHYCWTEAANKLGSSIINEYNHIILYVFDTAEWDNDIGGSTNDYRGHICLGGGDDTSKGGGSGASISQNVLYFVPDSKSELQALLMSEDLTPDPNGGELNFGWLPARGYGDYPYQKTYKGEAASVYMGALAHELGHAMGLPHTYGNMISGDTADNQMMGIGFPRFAAACFKMYGYTNTSNVVMESGSLKRTKLAPAHARNIYVSRFFNTNEPFTDNDDPTVRFAYPRYPAVFHTGDAPEFLVIGDDGSGSGIAQFMAGIEGNTIGGLANPVNSTLYKVDSTNTIMPVSLEERGHNLEIYATDNQHCQGMRGNDTMRFFRILNGGNKVLFVDPDPGDNNLSQPIGSRLNPYSSIQDAVTACSTDRGTVVLLPGTYKITSSIILKSNISIISDEPQKAIIDGQGGNFPIFGSPANYLWDVTIAYLVLQNAQKGIYIGHSSDYSYFIHINENIVRNMSSNGIDIYKSQSTGGVCGNTIDNCLGAGIKIDYLRDLYFEMKDNIVIRSNQGIYLNNYTFSANEINVGYNLCYDNTANWAGQSTYASSRKPGEISFDPIFVDSDNGDYRLIYPDSPAYQTGDPMLRDSEGAFRRSMGAVEMFQKRLSVKNFNLYE